MQSILTKNYKVMKKVFLISILLSFTFVEAQTNIVKVNPLGLAFGIANAGYEFTIADKQSITISGAYFKESGNQDVANVDGYGANVLYNFYFSADKVAPKGFHIAPGIGVFFLSNSTDNLSVLSLNATAGHQWILWEHFAIDVFAQYSYLTKTSLSGVNSSNIGLGLSLGYAW